MKFVMLTPSAGHDTPERFKAAAERRGHRLDIVNPHHCYMDITDEGLRVFHNGRMMAGYDAVIPFLNPVTAQYGMAVLRQFESMGVPSLNGSIAVGRARDKLQSLQLLARAGISVPATAFAHDQKWATEIVEMAGGAPAVIKLPEGRQGIGVVLAETMQSAQSTIEAFLSIKQHVLAQRFIGEAAGSDIRVIVIDDEVVATMKRTGRPGEFRSNLHRGGDPDPVEITATERALARGATRAIGLDVCGVDILRASDGPMVIEVNSTPGLRGAESVSGKDIAGKIIAFLETRAASARTARHRPRLVRNGGQAVRQEIAS